MMTSCHPRILHPGRKRLARAFTFTELMVSSAILMLVLAGVITSHVFGLKMISFTQAAAATTDDDRRAARRLMDDLATAKQWRIGYGSPWYFFEIGQNQLQTGNAIQIYPSAGSARYIRYYIYYTSSGSLCRITSEDSTQEVLLPSVLNYLAFTSEDPFGKTLTNQNQNAVMGMSLLIQDAATRTYGMRGSLTHNLQIKLGSRAPD
jgi:hypothetical protein